MSTLCATASSLHNTSARLSVQTEGSVSILGVWHSSECSDYSALRQAPQMKLFDYPWEISLQKKSESVVSLGRVHLLIAYFTADLLSLSNISATGTQINAEILVP